MTTLDRPLETKAQQEQFMRRVKFYLDQHGLTQGHLAEQLNTRPATVSSWMQGHSFPTGKVVARLPSVLGVSPSWLLSGEGAPFTGEDEREKSYQRGLEHGQRMMLERLRGALTALESEFYKHEATAQGGGREESWRR